MGTSRKVEYFLVTLEKRGVNTGHELISLHTTVEFLVQIVTLQSAPDNDEQGSRGGGRNSFVVSPKQGNI